MNDYLLDYGKISEYKGDLFGNGCLCTNYTLAGSPGKFRV